MDIQLKRGLLDVCVLATIKEQESYGYKIIKDLKPYVELSESTLYTILKRLELSNMITVYSLEHNGRIRKYYHITDLKAYTVKEGGYTKPVIMEAGRTIVTEVTPGKTVDIYSAASNVVNNPLAKLIVAYYDENDMFIEMDVTDFTDKSNGVEIDISNVELLKTSYTFPANSVAGCKFKAFIWNGMDDMIPLTASSEIEMPMAEVVE